MLESHQHPEQEFIRDLIKQKLENSNLSLRQLAKKWETSISLLSQVKNRKRKANLDLAIRIMQEMNVPVREKARYVELIQGRGSKNINLVSEELKNEEKRELLSEHFSKILDGESNALDIFLDISLSEEKGCSSNEILRNYGKQGLSVANLMANSDLIRKEDNRFYIELENTHFTPSRQTLFGIINKVNENLNSKVATNEFVGSYNLEIHDISEDALKELKELHIKQVAEVQNLISKNKKNLKEGGVRVSFSHVLGKMKDFSSLMICLFFISLSFTLLTGNTYATGGISGGHSGMATMDFGELSRGGRLNEIRDVVNIDMIKNQIEEGSTALSAPLVRLNSGGPIKERSIRADWHHFSLSLDNNRKGFVSKELAIAYLKETVSQMKDGNFNKEVVSTIRNECSEVAKSKSMSDLEIQFALVAAIAKEGLVQNYAMGISEFINKDYELRYKLTLRLMLPCKF